MKQKAIPKLITDSKTGTALFVLCWFAYFITYFGRLNYNANMVQLLTDGILTKPQTGAIGTAFFLAYAIGQLISGWLGDRLPPKWFVASGLMLSGLCNLAMGSTQSYSFMLPIWSVNGLVQSFVWSPLLRIICERYTDVPRRRACIQINTSVPAGTFFTYAFCAWLVSQNLWQHSFTISGLAICGFTPVWLFAMNAIEKSAELDGIEPSKPCKAIQEEHKRVNVGKLFLQAGLVFLCVALAMQGMLKDGVTAWAPVFLTEVHGIGTAGAIMSTTILPILNLSGAFFASFFCKRCKDSEIKAAMVLFGICGGCLLCLYAAGINSAIASLCLLAVSTTAMMAVNVLLISVLPTRFRKEGRVSTVSGILNFTVYMGTAFSNYGIGAMAAKYGWPVTILTWCILAFAATALCGCALMQWNKFHKKTEKEDKLS